MTTEETRLAELCAAKNAYRKLIARKRKQELSENEQSCLDALKDHINALEACRPRPDAWDVAHTELRRELAMIRQSAERLPER